MIAWEENKKMHDEEYDKSENSGEPSESWFLDSNNRNVGSIYSDTWEDTAASLVENRFIAVYPGSGWWKERSGLVKRVVINLRKSGNY